MSRQLVSVIIPVFNSETYLRECLDSVLAQEHTKLEIICVNDGSTDNTPEILAGYEQRDSRVSIITQDNLGVSAARNSALGIARGEFVMFVDSDDSITSDIVSNYLDHVEPGIDHLLESRTTHSIARDPYERKQFLYRMLRTQELNSPCGKLYRRSVIQENDLQFPKATSLGEDLLFNVAYFQKATSIRIVPGSRYKAKEVAGSVTRSFRPMKYKELMYVHDSLRSLLEPAQTSMGDSLLNFLRIRALLSCGTSLVQKEPKLPRNKIRQELFRMQQDNGPLPVKHGDLIMKILGIAYNRLGLVWTQVMVNWMRNLRSIGN